MPDSHEALVVNTLGHSAGALVFGIFLFLLLRDRAGARLRGSWLSVGAAGLAFGWNAGSLFVLTVASADPFVASLITAFSLSFLSLLPAVLLQLSLAANWKPETVSGYLTRAVGV